jgi:glutathione-regulated potassium-efflux system ancillary protein KefF
MADTLLLCAHPDLAGSHITRTLLEAARRSSRGPGHLQVRDLYALYPDYAIDGVAEQAALAVARRVIWLHPLHWYGMPALMKLWVDEVLSFGWAYGPGGTALQGKALWLVSSTGGSAASYAETGHNEHPIEQFLLPYRQTARLCGLRWLPPLLLHGAHQVSETGLQQHVQAFIGGLLRDPQSEAGWITPAEVSLDERPPLSSPLGVR